MKESVNVYHITNNIVEDYEPLNFDLLDENLLKFKNDGGVNDWWTMYFDKVIKVAGNRVGTMIIFLENKQYPISMRL